MNIQSSLNLPIILTLIRLLIAPLLMPTLLIYVAPSLGFWGTILLAVLFASFSLTDLLDGYFARKYNQETRIGKLLDPIADKFLFFATSIGLLMISRTYFYTVLILNGREIFIMGLRLIACEHNLSVPVSWYGKVKTTFQFIYFTVLILQPILAKHLVWYSYYELLLALFTVFISLGSAYSYYKNLVIQIQSKSYADSYLN